MPVLLALFGSKRGVRLEIQDEAVLGRSSSADLQLIDEKVSRQHCRLRMVPGSPRQLSVEDLGSQNGTYVNGERLESARLLRPGDEIAVGDSLFVLDGAGDVAAARFGDATLVVTAPPAEAAADSSSPERSGESASPAPNAAPAPERLARVAALLGTLDTCASLEEIARAVLAAIEQSLTPQRAFVLLWDAARGLPRPLVGRSTDATVSVSRTVLDLAARHRRAVVIEDAVEDRTLGRARSVARHQLRAVLVAPVLEDGRTIGFLHADRDRPPFSAEDAALLECFAAAFALARPRARASAAAGITAAGRAHEASGPPAGVSAAWQQVLRTAGASAAAPSTVLITGESGTGKEEIARFIHHESARAAGPFVAVNCGAIAEPLAESELFGHERGAFTGAVATRAGSIEAADGGTLFLDEIGELPPSLQVKLLRVLQERAFCRLGSTVTRRVDLRVVAATHRDLVAEVSAGRFREDLFYRVAVIRIHLPPLRDRPEDIPPLATELLARVAARLGRKDPGLSDEAVVALRAPRWPGNARELGNVLERAMVLRAPSDGGPLTAHEILAALGDGPIRQAPARGSLADKVAALERAEIEAALRQARGVKTRAAQALGLSRPTLDKKIADLGIDLWRTPDEGPAPSR